MPLFFDECESLFDYLPSDIPLVMVGNNFDSAKRFWGEVNNRYEEYGVDPRRPLVPPSRGFIAPEELYAHVGKHCAVEFRDNRTRRFTSSLALIDPSPSLPLRTTATSRA